MSVVADGDINTATTTTTTTPAATKRESSEVILDQHNGSESGSESNEQKRIETNRDDSSETRRRRRRSPRRGTASNWLLIFMTPTFDPPSTNPANPCDRQQARYIVRKTLYEADLSSGQARLLLTRTEMSPLLPLSGFLTPAEDNAVHNGEGLPVRALDWRGREYGMVFKFLAKTRAYRLIKQWGEFLRINKGEMSAGNVVETTWYRRVRDDGRGEVCVDLQYVRVEMHERKAAAAAVRKREFEEPMIKHRIKRIKIKHAQNRELVVAAAAVAAEQRVVSAEPELIPTADEPLDQRIVSAEPEFPAADELLVQRIVSAEPEFPTADELVVAEALLLLHVRR